ncbi:MAG: carboxypeptidase-like regulatory domain-containing protein [Gemmatimonadales bacterium]|nr:carboxypeptidase-like regulatory domain-containing protein [Gemmatimonadales bacterium]
MRTASAWIAASLLCLPVLSPLHSQVVATGVVTDASTKLPLAGVEVLIDGHNRPALTDAQGRFLIQRVPDGNRVVLFRLVGYRPVRTMAAFKRGDTTVVNGIMIGLAVQLDSVLVRGTTERFRGMGMGLEAFEERRKMGFGIFLDSTLLRRNEHRELGDLLRGEPGINVTRVRGGGWLIYAGRGSQRCLSQLYVDGIKFPKGTSTDMVTVSNLVAVEVYRSAAGVPLEYGGMTAACGVVLLWTRRGP